MKDYGLTKSTTEPQTVEIKETKVFVATNIKQVTVTTDDGDVQEYQFNLVQYDKDEYIKLIDEKNASLEQQVTDTQLALCDVYEMLG
jgi:hypothetical protein